MVSKWLKIVNKSIYRDQIYDSVIKIKNWNWESLDIKRIWWKKWYYRCRIWKIRIIFFEKDWNYFVDEVWYRGDIY